MKTSSVHLEPLAGGGITSARGFRAGATSAGVKDGPSRLDLAAIVSDVPCTAHAVFTQCLVVAAPVIVSRERVATGRAQGLVINSGNANACNGPKGLDAAHTMAEQAARHLGIAPDLMLVASTGVIGVPLPIDRITAAIPSLTAREDGGHDAARAIMTTDLVPKESAVCVEIGGRPITIGGIAKGSGMIHPNMATMLAVICTDAPLDVVFARSVLKHAADRSFNQVSVDGDTSTNDMLTILANGMAGGSEICESTPEGDRFAEALEHVCVDLARMIARDGEGATRLIEVTVTGARTEEDARQVARSIAGSNLLKAAVYGRDPNWGRILSAAGNAGVPLDPDAVDIWIGEHQVAARGMAMRFDSDAVSAAMGVDEVCITVALGLGMARGEAWGCDLTEGYVKINAEYTT